ncbi:MAG: N-acetylmuramoyl-L-alanine amidase [Dysgonamonadaceae bacterium]|nr:N-acetylmuramoyl-L-alanine amidase [Dysgonamonadaceae bacterium]
MGKEKIVQVVILITFLSFSCLSFISADNKENLFTVVLDPGHGGKDPGAIGRKGKEKNINLSVALLAGKLMEENHEDVKVVYTRKRDVFVELYKRADIANKNKANLFISIHTNSTGGTQARGPEVFTLGVSRTKENFEIAKKENEVIYLEDNYEEKYEGFNPGSSESYIIFEFMQNKYAEQSISFASFVQEELNKCVSWKGRGVKQAGYLVLARATMPRVLIELDFISNRAAEDYLLSQEGQKNYANAIYTAFKHYKADYDRKNGISDKKKEVSPQNEQTGAVYKVQILTSSKKLPENSLQFKGYNVDYYEENKIYKYTYGETSDWNEISEIRKSLLKDFKDAFIIRFENGKRIK